MLVVVERCQLRGGELTDLGRVRSESAVALMAASCVVGDTASWWG